MVIKDINTGIVNEWIPMLNGKVKPTTIHNCPRTSVQS